MKDGHLFFHKVGQIGSYRAVFFPESLPRDLAIGHGFGACSFKDKRTSYHFIIVGVNKKKNKREQKNKTKNMDEKIKKRFLGQHCSYDRKMSHLNENINPRVFRSETGKIIDHKNCRYVERLQHSD